MKYILFRQQRMAFITHFGLFKSSNKNEAIFRFWHRQIREMAMPALHLDLKVGYFEQEMETLVFILFLNSDKKLLPTRECCGCWKFTQFEYVLI